MLAGFPIYCRYGNVYYPKLLNPSSFIKAYVKTHGHVVLRLDKYITVLEIFGAMGFPKKDLIGKKLDTFIISPSDARIFRLNVANIRIFGGYKTINVLLYYKKILKLGLKK